MRIAILVNRFPCLSQTFVLNQITGLIDRGHDVDIYTRQLTDEGSVHEDVESYRLLERTRLLRKPPPGFLYGPRGLRRLIACFPRCPRLLLESLWSRRRGAQCLASALASRSDLEDYDVLHCHFGCNGEFGALLKLLGIQARVVTTFHGYDIREGLEQGSHIYRRLFEAGDCILSISRYNEKNLKLLGLTPGKIVYHPVGIDLAKFTWREPRSGDSGGPVRMVTVARLSEEKGLEHGLRALKLVVDRLADHRILWTILGTGPLAGPLEALAEELGIRESVRFRGEATQQEVIRQLQESDIFILPSLAEALPVSLMEAQAVGLPAVTTRVGSTDEIVTDGESGFIVPPGDPEALAEKLLFLATHPGAWTAFAEAGRKRVEQTFDIHRLNDRLIEIFRGVLAGCFSPEPPVSSQTSSH
jgi:colanic acid/amylovoran biosynthesis glycosyltransferase